LLLLTFIFSLLFSLISSQLSTLNSLLFLIRLLFINLNSTTIQFYSIQFNPTQSLSCSIQSNPTLLNPYHQTSYPNNSTLLHPIHHYLLFNSLFTLLSLPISPNSKIIQYQSPCLSPNTHTLILSYSHTIILSYSHTLIHIIPALLILHYSHHS
jgi:hypothetical protein